MKVVVKGVMDTGAYCSEDVFYCLDYTHIFHLQYVFSCSTSTRGHILPSTFISNIPNLYFWDFMDESLMNQCLPLTLTLCALSLGRFSSWLPFRFNKPPVGHFPLDRQWRIPAVRFNPSLPPSHQMVKITSESIRSCKCGVFYTRQSLQ